MGAGAAVEGELAWVGTACQGALHLLPHVPLHLARPRAGSLARSTMRQAQGWVQQGGGAGGRRPPAAESATAPHPPASPQARVPGRLYGVELLEVHAVVVDGAQLLRAISKTISITYDVIAVMQCQAKQPSRMLLHQLCMHRAPSRCGQGNWGQGAGMSSGAAHAAGPAGLPRGAGPQQQRPCKGCGGMLARPAGQPPNHNTNHHETQPTAQPTSRRSLMSAKDTASISTWPPAPASDTTARRRDASRVAAGNSGNSGTP